MQLYNDYSTYLRTRYGCKVYRIGIDAGFSCPNRLPDGSGGCLYCDDRGSRSTYTDPSLGVAAQISSRIADLKARDGATKFIAYFQAFTNTYGPVIKLKEIYDSVLPFPEIIGISIGTRADCVDAEKMALIASYRDRYDIWLELGLQSSHDRTLEAIGRGHSFGDFVEGVNLAKDFGVPVSAHVILGLPQETGPDMIETAKRLSDLRVSGVKIHLLHILKGSRLETMYAEGKVKLLGQDEYVSIACDFLEHLSPDIVVQRLTGEGPKDGHIAPAWALDKTGTIDKIRREMGRRGSWQGKTLSSLRGSRGQPIC
jgi:radical SAM protein (TIGR01212 family)